MPPRRRDRPAPPLRRPAKPTPEERARAVIAKAEAAPGDKVWLTFRVPLPRRVAEALVAGQFVRSGISCRWWRRSSRGHRLAGGSRRGFRP